MYVCVHSDSMGNQGAFITLTGGTDLKPKFTSYDAVVSPLCLQLHPLCLCARNDYEYILELLEHVGRMCMCV